MNFENMNIVSIDDNENNLYLIEMICSDINLKVKSFSDPLLGLMYVLKNPVDMILVDYMMPNLNGLEFIEEFRKKNKNVPIIMITAVGDNSDIHKAAYELGANDFLNKPLNFIVFEARVKSHLINYQNKLLLEDRAKHLEKEVEKAIYNLIKREHETLELLGKIAEYKDPETAYHVQRVAHYSKLLAKLYGLNEKEQDLIFYASPFHDLGKVGIEDKILLKAGKLNDSEYEVMKKHASIGYNILKDSQSEYLFAGGIISLTHHEKFDGSGYPKGLMGEEIHIFGRIVAIVDVFDALTSLRPYKNPWSFENAMEFLISQKNTHFDPKLVDLFVENILEVKKIYTSFLEK